MKKLSSLFVIALIAFAPFVFSSLNKQTSASPAPVASATPTVTPILVTTASVDESATRSKPYVFTLPDGLTIIVEEDHTAPIAAVQAWCATGSIHEGVHLGAGVSHILEHMLFKGTIHRPPGAIVEEVRHQGGYINAFTSYDKTVYVIDTSSAGVASAIDILADMMMNATLPIIEYNKEQEVIRREFAMEADDPNCMSEELLFKTVFHASPFREPVLGYLDIYNKLTKKDIMAYYKQRYVPNNICFIIVGDVDAEKIHEQLASIFQKYPRQSLAPVLVQAEPLQLGKRIQRDAFSTSVSYIDMAWRIPDDASRDFPVLGVLAAVLGLGKNSLLNQDVHEKKELVYQIRVSFDRQRLFCISATADLQKRVAAEAEILKQIESVKKDNVTAIELERAKKKLLFDRFYSLATLMSVLLIMVKAG